MRGRQVIQSKSCRKQKSGQWCDIALQMQRNAIAHVHMMTNYDPGNFFFLWLDELLTFLWWFSLKKKPGIPLFYIWHLFYTFVLSTVKKKKLTCRHIFIPWWIFPLAVTVFGDAFESTLWICKRRVCSFGSLQPYAKQMDRLTCWSLHERRDPDENENPMKLSMNAL